MALRACDRCHRHKERCSFTDGAQACSTCSRLNLICRISRRQMRMGRRPGAKSFPHGNAHVWRVEPSECSRSAHSSRAVGQERACEENTIIRSASTEHPPLLLPMTPNTGLRSALDALRAVADREQFSALHMPFVWGPSFIPELQIAVYSLLRLTTPTLTEGYLAFLGIMTHYHHRSSTMQLQRQEPNVYQAAKGLQSLRDLTAVRLYDAACALFLGQVMFVFNILIDETSLWAHEIIRNALISTRSWYNTLLGYAVMDTITICPVLIETVDCLVRREIPVLKFPSTSRIIVDRYAGICSSLLPHLYTLCERGNFLKNSLVGTRARLMLQSQYPDCLADIDHTIRTWTPQTTADFYEKYDQHEIQMMVTQAKTYRLAALLIIHRLQYPFGTAKDATAQQYANEIFSQIRCFVLRSARNISSSTPTTTATDVEATGFPFVFPLFLAMLEIQGPGEDLLSRLPPHSVQHVCAVKLLAFIDQVRLLRENGFDGSWFELVDGYLHVAVLP